jgi:hypothetical protein
VISCCGAGSDGLENIVRTVEIVREEVARFQRNERRGKSASKEDYRFYDITAWSLPLAFGLDAFWTDDTVSVMTSPVNEQTIQRIKTGSVSGRASTAYIIPYTTDAAAAMAIRLLQDGHRVAVSTNGLDWQIRASGLTNEMYRITFGQSHFVALVDRFVVEDSPLYQRFWADKKLPLHQEMIFASTGTKRPEDRAWKYVEALAGSDIQTNPPATNDAVAKSGVTFTRQVDQPTPTAIAAEIDQKVDFAKLEATLMAEGIDKFAKPQQTLLALIAEKRRALSAA